MPSYRDSRGNYHLTKSASDVADAQYNAANEAKRAASASEESVRVQSQILSEQRESESSRRREAATMMELEEERFSREQKDSEAAEDSREFHRALAYLERCESPFDRIKYAVTKNRESFVTLIVFQKTRPVFESDDWKTAQDMGTEMEKLSAQWLESHSAGELETDGAALTAKQQAVGVLVLCGLLGATFLAGGTKVLGWLLILSAFPAFAYTKRRGEDAAKEKAKPRLDFEDSLKAREAKLAKECRNLMERMKLTLGGFASSCRHNLDVNVAGTTIETWDELLLKYFDDFPPKLRAQMSDLTEAEMIRVTRPVDELVAVQIREAADNILV